MISSSSQQISPYQRTSIVNSHTTHRDLHRVHSDVERTNLFFQEDSASYKDQLESAYLNKDIEKIKQWNQEYRRYRPSQIILGPSVKSIGCLSSAIHSQFVELSKDAIDGKVHNLINTSYRELSRFMHPDKCTHFYDEHKQIITDNFMLIEESNRSLEDLSNNRPRDPNVLEEENVSFSELCRSFSSWLGQRCSIL